MESPVILFDGVCNLCSGFVQVMIRIDKKGQFKFASIQSDYGQKALQKFKLPTEEISTVVMVDRERVYTHADVALQIALRLGGLWRLFAVFYLIPRPLRNLIYNWVARNRYRWFGQKESCMIPTPELKNRFVG
jgi:predicted DCC family thiol-disulfide oxidoreductase YuxK